jgi:2-keto-4-pentenoate hydratase/2-oxohepta-3-ene-1,7-dioic acid hydratase in catechol pathway
MRLGTVIRDGTPVAALARDDRVLPLAPHGVEPWTVRGIAAAGAGALERVLAWAEGQPAAAWLALGQVTLGPAVPDPGAIYTIGHNYREPGEAPGSGPDRPLVYGKAASSVAAPGATLRWDRTLTDNVDAEVELGIVIGRTATAVDEAHALDHVFGYTIIDDISSRDVWLDGDQWLLGKSMPGFCPVGPWIVTPDELDPRALRLGCTINGEPIQADTTASMRFDIARVVAYLSRHATLRPGDLIASGTPVRLATPPGPGRRLRAGDTATAWIEGIGELTTIIA